MKRLFLVLLISLSFINLYGQTETIGGVAYTLPLHFTRDRGSVPVGYPLANTTVHLLDQEMKPVAGGEYGEIYVSGPSVGKEYYGNPLQTEKFFIRHQVDHEAMVRLFRTGDIARINDENIIEITGRADFLVKIRGIRIETAEIEEALNTIPVLRTMLSYLSKMKMRKQSWPHLS